MKIEKLLAMLMVAMVMMLSFTACDDKDEPDPVPEPDPNEVPKPDFGITDRSMMRDFNTGNFFRIFEYKGTYEYVPEERGNLMQVIQEEKWYYYPVDPKYTDKLRAYAHNSYLYNDYWQWADKDLRPYDDLYIGWQVYCQKRYGTICKQYIYTGVNHAFWDYDGSATSSLYGNTVDCIGTFNNSLFVLKDGLTYYVYDVTDKTYDDSNGRFYGSVFDGAEKMLREMYEYYGSQSIFLSIGDFGEPDWEHTSVERGTIAYTAKMLGITL